MELKVIECCHNLVGSASLFNVVHRPNAFAREIISENQALQPLTLRAIDNLTTRDVSTLGFEESSHQIGFRRKDTTFVKKFQFKMKGVLGVCRLDLHQY